jgi:4-amino-4-deoxy-L-arabinose transferase-like glycosyltransferase
VIGCVGWFLMLPLHDVLAFPTRVAVLPNLEADAAAYDAFAQSFAASWRIDALPTKHPPGWIVLLAAVYTVAGHSYVAGKLISWAALVLTVVLCARLAGRLYGRGAATIAALLCASSPGLRAYVGTLQYEVVTAALFTLFLVLSARVTEAAAKPAAIGRAVAAGLAGAALALTRETFVPVVMLAAVWVWWRLRKTRHRAAVVAVFATAAALPPLIWSVAQTVHHERVILIAEKGPKEFLLGNNPLANGTYNEPLVGMAEPAGLDFVRANPGRTVQLAVRKGLYMFGVLRDGWTAPTPAAVWIWRASTGVLPLQAIESVARGGWLLFACAVALYSFGAERWRQWWLVPAAAAVILAEHLATLGSFRFGIPLLPVLYVLASGPLARATRAIWSALRAPLPAIAAAVVLVLVVAAQFKAWPLVVTYRAADLDGLAAGNAVDDISGAPVRVADARRGLRPVVLLPDTYLPRGSVHVTVAMRASGSGRYAAPIARIALTHLDGTLACATDVAGSIPADRFTDVVVPCRLETDGPVTLAVFSLGETDLAIAGVRLAWQ